MNVFRLCETGSLHEMLGMPNQDCVNMAACGSVHVLQLCDGMGMAPRGTEAAQVASKAAFDAMRQTLVIGPRFQVEDALVAVRAGFASAYNSLLSCARANGWPLDDLQTTLMLCVFDETAGQMAYGYVGDGTIAVRRGAVFELAEQPQKGASSNATYGLTSTDMWRFGTREGVDALLVGTDGIGDCLRTCEGGAPSVPNRYGRALLSIPASTGEDERADFLRGIMCPRDADSDAFGSSPFDFVGDDRSVAIVWSLRDNPDDVDAVLECDAPQDAELVPASDPDPTCAPRAEPADASSAEPEHAASSPQRPKLDPAAIPPIEVPERACVTVSCGRTVAARDRSWYTRYCYLRTPGPF